MASKKLFFMLFSAVYLNALYVAAAPTELSEDSSVDFLTRENSKVILSTLRPIGVENKLKGKDSYEFQFEGNTCRIVNAKKKYKSNMLTLGRGAQLAEIHDDKNPFSYADITGRVRLEYDPNKYFLTALLQTSKDRSVFHLACYHNNDKLPRGERGLLSENLANYKSICDAAGGVTHAQQLGNTLEGVKCIFEGDFMLGGNFPYGNCNPEIVADLSCRHKEITYRQLKSVFKEKGLDIEIRNTSETVISADQNSYLPVQMQRSGVL